MRTVFEPCGAAHAPRSDDVSKSRTGQHIVAFEPETHTVSLVQLAAKQAKVISLLSACHYGWVHLPGILKPGWLQRQQLCHNPASTKSPRNTGRNT